MWLKMDAMAGQDKNILTAHLEEALEQSICPLCHVAIGAEHNYLDMLLYERVNDLGAREQLPALTEPVQENAPALTVTLPVGVPIPATDATTVNVTVTDWPAYEGSGRSDLMAVVVPALLIANVCVAPGADV